MKFEVDVELSSCAPEFANDMYDELVEGFYKVAERVRDTAKSLVPVKTGALRDSIRARKSKKKSLLGKAVEALTATTGYYKDDPAAFVFAGNRSEGVYYGHMVEYGTFDKPAHPFFRPAFDQNFNAALAEAQHAGRRAINKRRRLRRVAKLKRS